MVSLHFLVFTLFIGFGCSLASKNVNVMISPSNVTEGDGRGVEIVCTALVKDVLMISLRNGTGTPMAYVRDGARVTVTPNIGSRIQASGQLSSNGTRNFLKVMVTSPTPADSGDYTCIVAYLDQTGFMTSDTARGVLTVTAPIQEVTTTETPEGSVTYPAESILYNLLDRLVRIEVKGETLPYWIIGLTEQEREDLMRGIAANKTFGVFDKDSTDFKAVVARLAQLESFVYTIATTGNVSRPGTGSGATQTPPTDQKLLERVDKLENSNTNMTRQIEWLSEKVKPDPKVAAITSDVINRVKKLEVESSKMSKDVATLERKGMVETAFHSTFNHVDVKVYKGMTLTFPHIITQKGQGFDPPSGVFTAPVDGMYGFHLSIDNLGTGFCKIILKADNRYFALLVTGDSNDQGQTSISSVVDLKAGQKVMTLVLEVEGEILLRGWSYSAFTGYLIWAK